MRIRRRLWLAFLVSMLVGTLFFLYLHYAVTGDLSFSLKDLKFYGYTLLLSVVTGIGVFFLSRFLNKKAPWHVATALRFVIELVVMGLFTFIICHGALNLFLLIEDMNPDRFAATYHDSLVKFIILAVVMILIYTIIDFTLYTYNQFAALQIEAVKITSTQLTLQYEVLKTQLSPHYLFNSLNTISSLVYTNPAVAEQFIRKLAHTYQYILTTQDKQLVSLAEELAFLKAYFFLLKARFDAAVQLEVSLPRRALGSRIPPLTLQLLLENAVKHNAPSPDNPLLIKVFVSDKNLLTISNNIVPGQAKVNSFKVGLDNIRQRYQYFAQSAIEVAHTNDFVVELPLLYPAITL